MCVLIPDILKYLHYI